MPFRWIFLFVVACTSSLRADDWPDIRSIPTDLTVPPLSDGSAAAGKRVKQALDPATVADLYYTLYLPPDWQAGRRYPVIIEYPGNGPFENSYGDRCTGSVDDCCLGYGLSGGQGVIWACVPFVSLDGRHQQRKWWGDLGLTTRYCRAVVHEICKNYGGDPELLYLAGFSRGAIACNFVGLHDDEIATLWRGFICHSHYDGVRSWNYPGSDRTSAGLRLQRLRRRPQFISQEMSVSDTQEYLSAGAPRCEATYCMIPFRNHTATWVLRDLPERGKLREWFRATLTDTPILPALDDP